MTVSGEGALGVWHGVAEGQERAVDDWYNREHHAERIAIPGFLRARRYVNLGQGPRYFSRYDVSDVGVLASEPYLNALNNPSTWSQRIFPHYRATVRGAFEVKHRRGSADGGVMATLRFRQLPSEDADAFARQSEAVLEALTRAPGVLRAEMWLVNVPATSPKTREKELRAAAEDYPRGALVIDGSSPEALRSALETLLPEPVRSLADTDLFQLVFHAVPAPAQGRFRS